MQTERITTAYPIRAALIITDPGKIHQSPHVLARYRYISQPLSNRYISQPLSNPGQHPSGGGDHNHDGSSIRA